MKEFEKWAGDFYHQVSLNPKIKNSQETKEVFEEIAKDEIRHASIIQKIINIVNNNL